MADTKDRVESLLAPDDPMTIDDVQKDTSRGLAVVAAHLTRVNNPWNFLRAILIEALYFVLCT
jgi:hypothetical protein